MERVTYFFVSQLRVFIMLIISITFLMPQTTFAARLYLDANKDVVNMGDVFMVSTRIDSEGECVNVIKVEVAYDPTVLQFVDLNKGGSLVTLWVESELIIDREIGTVSFTGGVPGGYCGRIIGDPGLTNVIASLAFTTVSGSVATSSQVIIKDSSKVLLNNGRGEEAKLITEDYSFQVLDNNNPIVDELGQIIDSDIIAPEYFEVQLYTYEGWRTDEDFYISFNTTDKQSGISHYEILETNPIRFGYDKLTGKKSYWIVAESPYFLKDQTLSSKIIVRAIDKAGNMREAEVVIGLPITLKKVAFIGLKLGLLFVLIFAFVYIRKQGKVNIFKFKKKKTKSKKEEEVEDDKEDSRDFDITKGKNEEGEKESKKKDE